jgi:hypothetical protein
MLVEPESRICCSLAAATENGTSCSAEARFCAVTMICSMMVSSVAAKPTAGAASPRTSALRANVLVRYMFLVSPM